MAMNLPNSRTPARNTMNEAPGKPLSRPFVNRKEEHTHHEGTHQTATDDAAPRATASVGADFEEVSNDPKLVLPKFILSACALITHC